MTDTFSNEIPADLMLAGGHPKNSPSSEKCLISISREKHFCEMKKCRDDHCSKK